MSKAAVFFWGCACGAVVATLISSGVAYFKAQNNEQVGNCLAAAEQCDEHWKAVEAECAKAGATDNFAIVETDKIIHLDGRVEKLVDGGDAGTTAAQAKARDDERASPASVEKKKRKACEELKGEFYAMRISWTCVIPVLEGWTAAQLRGKENACIQAGGKVVTVPGQMYKLEVTCDLSEVK